MMCPFCLKENDLKALVCASCGRDIAVPESLLAERDDLVRKRDVLRSELMAARAELEAAEPPQKASTRLMECPFCAETIKDEAIACKHCSRDLRVARPVMLEIQEIVSELDRLQREIDRVNASAGAAPFSARLLCPARGCLRAGADRTSGRGPYHRHNRIERDAALSAARIGRHSAAVRLFALCPPENRISRRLPGRRADGRARRDRHAHGDRIQRQRPDPSRALGRMARGDRIHREHRARLRDRQHHRLPDLRCAAEDDDPRPTSPTRSPTGSRACSVSTSARNNSAAAPAPFRICSGPPGRWWALPQPRAGRFTPGSKVCSDGDGWKLHPRRNTP